MAFSEIRIRKGNPALGNCKYCGAPGNRCYDYCSRHNDESIPDLVDGEDTESENEDLLTPYSEPYRLENWDREDLIMYVGGVRELYL